jgi:hypothetical protein
MKLASVNDNAQYGSNHHVLIGLDKFYSMNRF